MDHADKGRGKRAAAAAAEAETIMFNLNLDLPLSIGAPLNLATAFWAKSPFLKVILAIPVDRPLSLYDNKTPATPPT